MVPRSSLYFARLPSPVPPVRRWPKGPSALPSPARWPVRRWRCVAAPLPHKGSLSFPWDKQKSPKENFSLGVNNWKVLTDAAWRIGAKGLESIFLKGGSALTVKTIYESLINRLSGKLLMEAANYEIKKKLVKQGGRLAAVNLDSRAGLLAAKQGLARAASRYVGLRSVMTLL